MFSRYDREAYQFLAVYRFLAYALAVMFTQVAPALLKLAPSYKEFIHPLDKTI